MAAETHRAPRVALGQTSMAIAAAEMAEREAAKLRGQDRPAVLLRHLQLRGAA